MASRFEFFGLSDEVCCAIWIDLAGDPYVFPRPRFKLSQDANFAEFERLIRKDQSAAVTLIGRLDGVDEIKSWTYVRSRRKNKDGSVSVVVGSRSSGFGQMGTYKARLVVKQVLAVAPSSAGISTPPTR